jgi:gas vesicle protein
MAYEYDRLEREEGGGSFLMGLLAGTVLGAGLGMLFAPKAGNELRNQLTEQAGRLRSTAGDTYGQATEKVHQIVDRGREAYDRARSTAPTGSDIGLGSSGNLGTGTSSGPGTTGSLSGAGTFSNNRT